MVWSWRCASYSSSPCWGGGGGGWWWEGARGSPSSGAAPRPAPGHATSRHPTLRPSSPPPLPPDWGAGIGDSALSLSTRAALVGRSAASSGSSRAWNAPALGATPMTPTSPSPPSVAPPLSDVPVAVAVAAVAVAPGEAAPPSALPPSTPILSGHAPAEPAFRGCGAPWLAQEETRSHEADTRLAPVASFESQHCDPRRDPISVELPACAWSLQYTRGRSRLM